MFSETEIRESALGDIDAIEGLYPQAFPDEDLLRLVRQLLSEVPTVMSIVALTGENLSGHIVFTECATREEAFPVALLGPLAVAPERQKRGIGTMLVRQGLERMRARGIGMVCVLGDPAYYERFGFLPEADIETPYPFPDEWREAWQSISLEGGKPATKDRLVVPKPWRRPELWAP